MQENFVTKSELKDVIHSVEKLSIKLDHESKQVRTEMQVVATSAILKLAGVVVGWTSLLAYLQKV